MRSIRYALEVEGIEEIIASDISLDAFQLMSKNVEDNEVYEIVKPLQMDARYANVSSHCLVLLIVYYALTNLEQFLEYSTVLKISVPRSKLVALKAACLRGSACLQGSAYFQGSAYCRGAPTFKL